MSVNPGRFASLLGELAEPRASYDYPLLDRRDWVVAPSLGALLPNWLLIVPKVPVLNLARWQAAGGANPMVMVGDLASHLAVDPNRLIWFEHGASHFNTAVGCGLDHAHLHVLIDAPFSAQDLQEACRASAPYLDWAAYDAEHVFTRPGISLSYLTIGSGTHAVLTTNVEKTGSQFIRRAIASMIGESGWDYKAFAHEEHIAATIRNFTELAQAGCAARK